MQLSVVISGMQAVPEIDRSVTSPRSPLFGHDTQLSGGISGQCMPYSRVCFQKRGWPGHGPHSDIVCRPCADSPDAHKFPRFLFRVAAPVQTDLPPCKSLGERLYGSCSGSGDAERPQALFQRPIKTGKIFRGRKYTRQTLNNCRHRNPEPADKPFRKSARRLYRDLLPQDCPDGYLEGIKAAGEPCAFHAKVFPDGIHGG